MAGPNIPVNKGLSMQAVRNIPKTWDAQWFKRFIADHMQRADFRNAIAVGGISITGTEQSSGTISINGTGPANITAPAGGQALNLYGAAGQPTAYVYSANAATGHGDFVISRTTSVANSVAAGPNLYLNDSGHTTDATFQLSGGQIEIWQYSVASGWQQVMYFGTTGGLTLPVPYGSAINTLTVNGPTGAGFAQIIQGNTNAGVSYGLFIAAGTNASDTIFDINNASRGAEYFRIYGDGSVCISTSTKVGAGNLSMSGIVYAGGGTYLMGTNAALSNYANTLTATLTNSPVTGNPTKWIGINDNGTLRRFPVW